MSYKIIDHQTRDRIYTDIYIYININIHISQQPNNNQIKVALFTFANKYPLIRFLL